GIAAGSKGEAGCNGDRVIDRVNKEPDRTVVHCGCAGPGILLVEDNGARSAPACRSGSDVDIRIAGDYPVDCRLIAAHVADRSHKRLGNIVAVQLDVGLNKWELACYSAVGESSTAGGDHDRSA